MLKPEEFRNDILEYFTMCEISELEKWQKDIVERMIKDFAMITQQIDATHTHTYNKYPLDICAPTPCPQSCPKVGYGNKAKQEDKNPMASYAHASVVTADSIESSQRSIVRDTLRSTAEKLKDSLKKAFGMIDDDRPETPAEFVQRIADGKYTIDEKYSDMKAWNPAEYIRWRDPAVVEDKAGYKAARAQLDEAYEEAKLKAALLPVADLLQLVEDFKAWKHA